MASSLRTALALLALFTVALTLPGCAGGSKAPEGAAAAEARGQEESPAPAGAPSPSTAKPEALKVPPAEPSEPIQVGDDFSPAEATGSVEGVPAATNTAPIVAIANFYADLPGIDMSSLTAAQREKFLQRANSELCTCGCKNDTLAKCYVNDKNCPVVRDLLLKVLEEVRAGK